MTIVFYKIQCIESLGKRRHLQFIGGASNRGIRDMRFAFAQSIARNTILEFGFHKVTDDLIAGFFCRNNISRTVGFGRIGVIDGEILSGLQTGGHKEFLFMACI